MERALGLEPSSAALDPPVRKAIAIKLDHMIQDPERALWYTYWLLVTQDHRQAVGLIGFKGPRNEQDEAEIGYGTQPPFQGQGYMTEALRALVRWGLDADPGICIVAQTEKDNIPSQRVLEKAGFCRSGESDTMLHWVAADKTL